jgi:hypothetical protein
MRCRRPLLLLLAAAWLAAPAAAYTIYLKDGSRIMAKGKYTVDGDKAIIRLESGTQTFLPFSEIDVERTDAANQTDLGGALVFDDGKFVDRSEVKVEVDEGPSTLGDLIDSGEATMRGSDETGERPATTLLPGVRNPEGLAREPLRDIELGAALKSAFTERGVAGASTFQGSGARPLVELQADSEASVFRNLEIAADVLLAIQEQHPGELEVLEVLMLTSGKQRAGEFALTTAMAQAIASDSVELSSFFVRHVRF